MHKLLSYFIALFVLFFACTPDASDTTTSKAKTSKTKTAGPSDIPVSTPIPAPKEPPAGEAKIITQAPKKDLIYPKQYRKMGIPQLAKSTVANNLMIDNSQGKYGQRIKLRANGTHESAMSFYAQALVKNGWEQNSRMDKTVEDEDVKYFSTNYTKDDYTLMLAVTGTSDGGLYIDQILKEN